MMKVVLEKVGDGVLIKTPLGEILVNVASGEIAISSNDVSYVEDRWEGDKYIEVWN